MTRLLLILLFASTAAPALAQHADHEMPAVVMQPAQQPAADDVDSHAGHERQSTPTPSVADPYARHKMPPETTGADPHAEHGATGHAPEIPNPPVAQPSAAARSGPQNAADAFYDPKEMTEARKLLRKDSGAITAYNILIDRLETRIHNDRDGYAWDAQAWYGGDINRLWFKTEGEGSFGLNPEKAEVQALYSRALDPWFNLQAGMRYDLEPNPERAHLVLGIQGLAPYWFEVGAAVFLSEKGDLSARIDAEYDLRITQKLILQPQIELNLAAQDVPELHIGSGLSTVEAGLRLRYQFVPEFAPYIGIVYERAFGTTADFARAAGNDVGGWSFLVGIRTWF